MQGFMGHISAEEQDGQPFKVGDLMIYFREDELEIVEYCYSGCSFLTPAMQVRLQ